MINNKIIEINDKPNIEITQEYLDYVKDKIAKDNIKYLILTRNNLLNDTDKYLLADFPITHENLIIIKDYRNKLRDFTKNNYILPKKPDFIN